MRHGLEVHEDTAEIFVIFLDPVVKLPCSRLVQEAQNAFFQLPAPLASDDLQQGNPLAQGLIHDPAEFGIDRLSLIKNIMQV